MDFFEHQAQAKAASNRLLLLFLLVCFVFVMLVNSIIYIFFESFQGGQFNAFRGVSLSGFVSWQLSLAGFYASLLSVFMIGIGCFARWYELRKGGNGLAVSLGARSLGFASKVEKEQQLINVVEEMAIASGVTTPGIYVLDNETAINAFVAGYSFEDSALIVTHGLLNQMNREELQAVVGHEFSHILHGDNRINIRLLVLLAGFVWVAELGKMLLLDSRHRHSYHSRSTFGINLFGNTGRNRRSANGIFFIGIPLIIVGYVGVFFGRLVRTSISRKREFLADASSVQFTRNPEALASALNVILLNSHQGLLKTSRSEEISHMCIAPSQKASWFATHPPLLDRINTIDSTFLKRDLSRKRKQTHEKQKAEKQLQNKQATQAIYGADVTRLQNQGTEYLHNVIGTVSVANLAYAMKLHDDIPYEYRQALKDPERARLMMLYLLLDTQADVREKQLAWIETQIKGASDYLNTLTLMSRGLHSRLMLPLVELLIPLLKSLKPEIQQGLLEQVLIMAKWDGQLNMFEVSLYTLLKQSFEQTSPRASSHSIKKISVVAYEFNVIISSLIHLTGGSTTEKQALHQRMINVFSMKSQTLIEQNKLKPKDIYNTLKKLRSLSPMLKRSLMDVCGDIVLHDGIVLGEEYETLRLMSLIMACPIPPFPTEKAS
jgi:Zn-dependent protease with chaperone function